MGLGLRRRLEEAATRYPKLRRVFTASHILWADRLSHRRRHPIDRLYGIRTQSPVPLYLNRAGSAVDAQIVPYGGCVASVLRHVLARLAPVDAGSFIDIGCGKGRALVIASEYPFRRIIGVELNPDLAAAARANARRVGRRFPDRTTMDVRVGDASEPDLPEGDLVVFLYHPFGRMLVERLCAHVASAAKDRRSVTIVYENPVHGAVFDAHPAFVRRYAAMLPCSEDELGFVFDPQEAVLVWHAASDEIAVDRPASRPIVTVKPEYRVIVG